MNSCPICENLNCKLDKELFNKIYENKKLQLNEQRRKYEKNNPKKNKLSRDKATKKFKLNNPNYFKEYHNKNKDYINYIQRCYKKACSIYKKEGINFN
jgi:hypothetical protein